MNLEQKAIRAEHNCQRVDAAMEQGREFASFIERNSITAETVRISSRSCQAPAISHFPRIPTGNCWSF